MPLKVTKVGLARAALGAYLILDYHREMEENYKNGDWLEAAKDTGFFAVKMLPVVAPAFLFGALAPYWIGAAVGVGATMAIVELTGIGSWRDVRDLLLDPDPVDWWKTVAPEVKREVVETVNLTLGVASMVYRMAQNETQRKLEFIEMVGKGILDEFEELNDFWLNPTPGLRPF
jgi:hypothetical protein